MRTCKMTVVCTLILTSWRERVNGYLDHELLCEYLLYEHYSNKYYKISPYTVRAEQHDLKFSPAMSNCDFLSYLKNEGLQDMDCSKLSGNYCI